MFFDTESATPEQPLRVLYASSEVYPFKKTGGLADVAANLPKALNRLGADIRIIMPAYHDSLEKAGPLTKVAQLTVQSHKVIILESVLPGSLVKVWLVAALLFASRRGDPYNDTNNRERPDNAHCFDLFCRVVSEVAVGIKTLHWRPDIVHCNDWQTGLVPMHLLSKPKAPPVLFTIHNLAYQGLFPHSTFVELGLDESLWRYDALEYFGQLSFIKGGITYAQWVNTVSPHYAQEILTPQYGQGLDALLHHRQGSYTGILNGIDPEQWDPANDKCIDHRYDLTTFTVKKKNKLALQKSLGLPQDADMPVFGWVGRLVQQKGIDLLLLSLASILLEPIQLVILGSGDSAYEAALQRWAESHPRRLVVSTGFNEALAHQIIAGADFFLMPSRFEPCGLTQLYSLRYGTIPVASRTGGLVDTIVPLSTESLRNGTTTGILFDLEAEDTGDSLVIYDPLAAAVTTAVQLYANRALYQRVQMTAMKQDFSWKKSALQYLDVYQRVLDSGADSGDSLLNSENSQSTAS